MVPITVTLRKSCKAQAIAETFCNSAHHRGKWSSDELKTPQTDGRQPFWVGAPHWLREAALFAVVELATALAK